MAKMSEQLKCIGIKFTSYTNRWLLHHFIQSERNVAPSDASLQGFHGEDRTFIRSLTQFLNHSNKNMRWRGVMKLENDISKSEK